MEPSNKSPKIEKFLNDVIGASRRDHIKANCCIPPPLGCGKPATHFKDELSRKEFSISGLCQDCQDAIYG